MQARGDDQAGDPPLAIVLIGVSGSGKSTIGKGLALAIDATFLEGDEFHSPANVAKMRSGQPLTDEDRHPWLESIGAAIAHHVRQNQSVVVACSALRRDYRDTLSKTARSPLIFIHLTIDPAILGTRMNARSAHFMPVSLLASQLATLEPLQADETGTQIRETGTADKTITRIVQWLRAHTKKGGAPTTLSRL